MTGAFVFDQVFKTSVPVTKYQPSLFQGVDSKHSFFSDSLRLLNSLYVKYIKRNGSGSGHHFALFNDGIIGQGRTNHSGDSLNRWSWPSATKIPPIFGYQIDPAPLGSGLKSIFAPRIKSAKASAASSSWIYPLTKGLCSATNKLHLSQFPEHLDVFGSDGMAFFKGHAFFFFINNAGYIVKQMHAHRFGNRGFG